VAAALAAAVAAEGGWGEGEGGDLLGKDVLIGRGLGGREDGSAGDGGRGVGGVKLGAVEVSNAIGVVEGDSSAWEREPGVLPWEWLRASVVAPEISGGGEGFKARAEVGWGVKIVIAAVSFCCVRVLVWLFHFALEIGGGGEGEDKVQE